MNNQVLKRCPFCSCADVGEVTINARLESRHRRFKVYCKVCQCRTSEHKTRKGARTYWNTRATGQPSAMVVPSGLKALHRELQTNRWMGADEGWDKAIEAVSARIAVMLAAAPAPGDDE